MIVCKSARVGLMRLACAANPLRSSGFPGGGAAARLDMKPTTLASRIKALDLQWQ